MNKKLTLIAYFLFGGVLNISLLPSAEGPQPAVASKTALPVDLKAKLERVVSNFYKDERAEFIHPKTGSRVLYMDPTKDVFKQMSEAIATTYAGCLTPSQQELFKISLEEAYSRWGWFSDEGMREYLDDCVGASEPGKILLSVTSKQQGALVGMWRFVSDSAEIKLAYKYLWGTILLRFAPAYKEEIKALRNQIAERWLSFLQDDPDRFYKEVNRLAEAVFSIIGIPGACGVALVAKDAMRKYRGDDGGDVAANLVSSRMGDIFREAYDRAVEPDDYDVELYNTATSKAK